MLVHTLKTFFSVTVTSFRLPFFFSPYFCLLLLIESRKIRRIGHAARVEKMRMYVGYGRKARRKETANDRKV
jgi:hypothetical protein